MSEKIKISEGTIISFLIGFSYTKGNGIRLSKENTEIVDKINFKICNSISNEVFQDIENKIFEKKELLYFVNKWYELCNEEEMEQTQLKKKLFTNHSDISSDSIRINQEMIFAFFCGIANTIPVEFPESQFFEMYEKYLNMIVKKFCDNIDNEKLCDVEHYLNSNQALFEIRDSIIMVSGVKPSWRYPKNTQPDEEDEEMLKKFQEEFK